MNELDELDLLGVPFVEGYDFMTMLLRFSFNTAMVWIMILACIIRKARGATIISLSCL